VSIQWVQGLSTHVIILNERGESPDAPIAENLYGFSLTFSHVLVPEHLVLEVAKPFLWGDGRFDSPLDVLLILPWRPLKKWEFSVGAGVTWNVRVFDPDREEIEGQGNEISLGFLGTVALAYRLTPRWFLEALVDSAYIPGNVIVTAELSPAFGVVHSF